MPDKKMNVEVAYALKEEQFLYKVLVNEGTTAEDAIKASPLLKLYPDLDYSKIGIFSKPAQLDTVLREMDRVEIYRPLVADPRDRRRKQVEQERQSKK